MIPLQKETLWLKMDRGGRGYSALVNTGKPGER